MTPGSMPKCRPTEGNMVLSKYVHWYYKLQMQGYNSDFMLLSLKQNARLLECHYFMYSSVNLIFAPSVPNVMAIVYS